jgi:4-amino-4-deoxy-L-arabinose transferase-like glycosyltransferase
MRRPAIVLAALVLLIVLVRIPVLTEVPERDITTYAVIGQGLLEGRSLYADLWDHKPPGVHLVYAAAIAVTGQDARAIYLLSVLGSILGLFGVWSAARQFGDRDGWGALLAGLMWVGISGAFRLQGEMPNTELLSNGFLAFGFCGAVRLLDEEASLRRGLATGLLFAGASLFKHLLVVIPGALLVSAWIVAHQRRRHIARQGLLWLLTGSAVWACVVAWFMTQGNWRPFYEAVFEYNRYYGGSVGANLLASLHPSRLFPPEFQFAIPILAFSIAGALLDRQRWTKWIMLGTYLLASALIVALHPGPYSHYRIVLLVPLCVGFGWSVTSLTGLATPARRRLGKAIAIVVLVAVTVPELAALRVPGSQWAVKRFGQQFVVAAHLGTALGRQLPKTCDFYELGAETQLYFFSGREPPSGVFYSMPLESGPMSQPLQRRVVADLGRHDVCLLIVNSTVAIEGPLSSYIDSVFASSGRRITLNPGRWLELRPRRGERPRWLGVGVP